MKIHFRFFLSHVKLVKTHEKYRFYRVFLPILLRKMRQRRGVTYDVINELQRLSLSKSCPALCHKLIYEIAIFHSITEETCDKVIYDMKYTFLFAFGRKLLKNVRKSSRSILYCIGFVKGRNKFRNLNKTWQCKYPRIFTKSARFGGVRSEFNFWNSSDLRTHGFQQHKININVKITWQTDMYTNKSFSRQSFWNINIHV